MVLGIIIGVFIGAFIGVSTMALLNMSKDTESKPQKREPAKLWAVDNVCRWKGKIFEIKRFSTTADNQTVVQLVRKSSEHDYWIWVPVEELEAMAE